MDKESLSESDICDKCIRPAMERAGWHPLDQIYREFPLRAGRVVVRGKTARRDASTVLRAALYPPCNESLDTTKQLAQVLVKNIACLEL